MGGAGGDAARSAWGWRCFPRSPTQLGFLLRHRGAVEAPDVTSATRCARSSACSARSGGRSATSSPPSPTRSMWARWRSRRCRSCRPCSPAGSCCWRCWPSACSASGSGKREWTGVVLASVGLAFLALTARRARGRSRPTTRCRPARLRARCSSAAGVVADRATAAAPGATAAALRHLPGHRRRAAVHGLPRRDQGDQRTTPTAACSRCSPRRSRTCRRLRRRRVLRVGAVAADRRRRRGDRGHLDRRQRVVDARGRPRVRRPARLRRLTVAARVRRVRRRDRRRRAHPGARARGRARARAPAARRRRASPATV